MPKPVWKTRDGEIFESQDVALEHEAILKKLEDYEKLIFNFCHEKDYILDEECMHDLAAYLLEHE